MKAGRLQFLSCLFALLTHIIALGLAAQPALAASAGSTGAAFLELGIGPRAGAMGEAYTAWADDVYGLYFNPSGLARLQRQEIGFAHNTLYLDMDYNYLGYVLPMPRAGAFAITGQYVDLGSVDRRKVDASGGPTASLGNTGGSDLAISLSYGRAVADFLDLGATIKFINEKLSDYSASAVAVDLGAKWYLPLRGWTVGASVSNIGSSLKFVRGREELPVTLRGGLGYRSANRIWGLTGDAVWVRNQNVEGKVGGEVYIWPEHLALRAGYNSANDVGRGYTLGAGFKWNDLAVDYAYVPFGDLGDQNLISVGYQFGPVRPRVIPERSRQAETVRPASRTPTPTPAEPTWQAPTAAASIHVAAFTQRSGDAADAWIGPATASVLARDWGAQGLPQAPAATARYRVEGDYWIMEDHLIIGARLLRHDNSMVAGYNVNGNVAQPFDAWNDLNRRINLTLAGEGVAVTPPAPRRAAPPSPPPAPAVPYDEEPAYQPVQPYAPRPVAAPAPPQRRAPAVVAGYSIALEPLREYPDFAETSRTLALSDSLNRALATAGWRVAPDAPCLFTGSVSFLDGGDVFFYGRLVDRATGVPLGVIEVTGRDADLDQLAAQILEAVAARYSRE